MKKKTEKRPGHYWKISLIIWGSDFRWPD